MLKHAAIALILAGSFYSCAKRAESGGEVPYKSCSCEQNDDPLTIIKGEICLLNTLIEYDYDPYIDYRWTRPNECMGFVDNISFIRLTGDNPNLDKLGSVNGGTVFYICNLPDFAKQWHSGSMVYYEGIVYPNCEEFGCRDFCYSLILTKLKIIYP